MGRGANACDVAQETVAPLSPSAFVKSLFEKHDGAMGVGNRFPIGDGNPFRSVLIRAETAARE
jgi:hypothetical protein